MLCQCECLATAAADLLLIIYLWVGTGDPVDKNPPANSGDMDSIPGQEDTTCLGAAKLVCRGY